MDTRIEKALEAAIAAFEQATQQAPSNFTAQLKTIFNQEENFLRKVDLLDQQVDEHPAYEAIREVIFDLLLMNFFAADVEKLEEDYLESPEWEQIEEQTIDRGTELLNLLLYLKECADEDIDPTLDDFLKEFLLVDEDEFQDEHRIYEPMLANQLLIESDYAAIKKAATSLPQEQELAELFYPMMSFFSEQQPSETQLDQYVSLSDDKPFDAATYALIVAYNQN